jgi:small subunit ribosomal protein S11
MQNNLNENIKIILKKNIVISNFFITNNNYDFTKNKSYTKHNFLKKIYVCYFKTTKNNIFVTITNLVNTKIIFSYSIGKNNLKKTINTAAFFGKILGEYIGLLLKNKKISNLIIRIKGINILRKFFIKGILKFKFNILHIEDLTTIPFNGCKFKKKKRKTMHFLKK